MTPAGGRTIEFKITTDSRGLTIASLRMQLREMDRENRDLRVAANADRTLIQAAKTLGREQERDLMRHEQTVAELRSALTRKDTALRQTTRELSERIRENDQLRKQRDDARASLAISTFTKHTGPITVSIPHIKFREAPLGN